MAIGLPPTAPRRALDYGMRSLTTAVNNDVEISALRTSALFGFSPSKWQRADQPSRIVPMLRGLVRDVKRTHRGWACGIPVQSMGLATWSNTSGLGYALATVCSTSFGLVSYEHDLDGTVDVFGSNEFEGSSVSKTPRGTTSDPM